LRTAEARSCAGLGIAGVGFGYRVKGMARIAGRGLSLRERHKIVLQAEGCVVVLALEAGVAWRPWVLGAQIPASELRARLEVLCSKCFRLVQA
jgi:hypothetical protein